MVENEGLAIILIAILGLAFYMYSTIEDDNDNLTLT